MQEKDTIIKELESQFFSRSLRKLHWPSFTHKAPGSKTNHAIVILATPRFASWLEDYVEFVPHVLTHLKRSLLPRNGATMARTRTWPVPEEETDPEWHFDVICACVDGVATRTPSEQNVMVEGLSFLWGRTSSIAPDLWHPEPVSTERNPMQSSLTFVSDEMSNDGTLEHHAITLPLANTLFTNGKISTLITSRWEYKSDFNFKKLKIQEKANQKIVALERFGAVHIPALPLTPPRRISSGLGNIVRRLELGENSIPASEELEASIDAYLMKTQKQKSTIQVWALVIPSRSFPNGPLKTLHNLLSTEEEFRWFWGNSGGDGHIGSPGHWIKKGATFCRVRKSLAAVESLDLHVLTSLS